jgi:hypothetical protein
LAQAHAPAALAPDDWVDIIERGKHMACFGQDCGVCTG